MGDLRGSLGSGPGPGPAARWSGRSIVISVMGPAPSGRVSTERARRTRTIPRPWPLPPPPLRRPRSSRTGRSAEPAEKWIQRAAVARRRGGSWKRSPRSVVESLGWDMSGRGRTRGGTDEGDAARGSHPDCPSAALLDRWGDTAVGGRRAATSPDRGACAEVPGGV